jgi:hypothetical protein
MIMYFMAAPPELASPLIGALWGESRSPRRVLDIPGGRMREF